MSVGDRHILSVLYAKLDRSAAIATKGIVSEQSWAYLRQAMLVGFSA
ncbi:hypothetical protein [Protofrankia symbiont of Coriaria ruscifolia]|nr:hypothetical protein [Protofrankia symbiont of Coriaria ruscifolia]